MWSFLTRKCSISRTVTINVNILVDAGIAFPHSGYDWAMQFSGRLTWDCFMWYMTFQGAAINLYALFGFSGAQSELGLLIWTSYSSERFCSGGLREENSKFEVIHLLDLMKGWFSFHLISRLFRQIDSWNKLYGVFVFVLFWVRGFLNLFFNAI